MTAHELWLSRSIMIPGIRLGRIGNHPILQLDGIAILPFIKKQKSRRIG